MHSVAHYQWMIWLRSLSRWLYQLLWEATVSQQVQVLSSTDKRLSGTMGSSYIAKLVTSFFLQGLIGVAWCVYNSHFVDKEVLLKSCLLVSLIRRWRLCSWCTSKSPLLSGRGTQWHPVYCWSGQHPDQSCQSQSTSPQSSRTGGD